MTYLAWALGCCSSSLCPLRRPCPHLTPQHVTHGTDSTWHFPTSRSFHLFFIMKLSFEPVQSSFAVSLFFFGTQAHRIYFTLPSRLSAPVHLNYSHHSFYLNTPRPEKVLLLCLSPTLVYNHKFSGYISDR